MEYFSEVQTLNRGMDLAQAAVDRNDAQVLAAERQRNSVKAQRLRRPNTGANHYTAAHAAIGKHL
jgi:hypothetical protein